MRRVTLSDYLKKRGLSDADFAKRVGMNRTVIWSYRTGRRMPMADKVAVIEKATGGLVGAKDFSKAA